jgi:predicted metalloprotease with PDZ domain
MEHLRSTQVIEPGALGDSGIYEETVDGAAHEFFHVWNVKRLRPLELGPWDFTRPANTRGLWIAEGITNYYGHLMQRRAGLWDDKKLFTTLAAAITEIENAPGSKLTSAEESSLISPFIDDAPHAQQTNLANSTVNYYPKGETLGLVLDLLIRQNSNGKLSLDDVMRAMYDEFYLQSPKASYYLRGRGYTNEDFARVMLRLTDSDAHDFFKRYVRGVERPPYEEALGVVGLRLVRSSVAPVSLGVTGDEDDAVNFKVAAVRGDSPAANAGLQAGDVIAALGSTRLNPDNFFKVLGHFKPGDRIAATIVRDGRMITKELILSAPQVFDYRIEEMPNATPAARALRAAWLKGK